MRMNGWAMLALGFLASPAFAQSGRSMADEYEKQIKSAEVIGALGIEGESKWQGTMKLNHGL